MIKFDQVGKNERATLSNVASIFFERVPGGILVG